MMDRIRKLNLEPTAFGIYVLMLFGIFIVENLVGNTPNDKLIAILVTIFFTSTIAILAGYIVFKDILTLGENTRLLLRGLEDLQQSRAILVSNEALKIYESRANRVRIITPDLYDDENDFYDTILSNIKANRKYEYVIPDREELIGKMERLLECLQRDAELSEPHDLPIRYKVSTDAPIIIEYVIYDGATYGELTGFVEIKVGPNENDTTNMPLGRDEVHTLNRWIDQLFVE